MEKPLTELVPGKFVATVPIRDLRVSIGGVESLIVHQMEIGDAVEFKFAAAGPTQMTMRWMEN